jgi:protein-disulfide isomerase
VSRLLLVALVLIGALFGAGGTWLAERIAPSELSGADQARLGRAVREYVLANPELIREASQRLRDKDTAKLLTGVRGDIETPVGSAWAGNPKGDVTVVEYFDYNCGYCRAILPTIDRLIADDPKVRVVYRELPVLAESSRAAAQASLKAATQGKFARFHQALYAAGPVSGATIAAAARVAGVDLAQPAPDGDAELSRNLSTAARLGMGGTPSWVIGDRILSGALPLDQLKEAIAAARAR